VALATLLKVTTENLADDIAKALEGDASPSATSEGGGRRYVQSPVGRVDGRDGRHLRLPRHGEADSETFKCQRERLRQERDELFEKLPEADFADDAYLVTRSDAFWNSPTSRHICGINAHERRGATSS
jgi:hypothetical protein